MIEAAGSWELGWSAPLTELDRWWAVHRSFKLERLNMFPVSGLSKPWLSEYKSFEDLILDKQHLTPVYVDERGEVELSDFRHPENALYIFGKANYAPWHRKQTGDASVRIDTACDGMLWPDQCLALVLYDRGHK